MKKSILLGMFVLTMFVGKALAVNGKEEAEPREAQGISLLDINLTDPDGNTALHVAARTNQFDMMWKLLGHPYFGELIDLDIRNDRGKQPWRLQLRI